MQGCAFGLSALGGPWLVRAAAAVDPGLVVNPDELADQVERAIVRSANWTLYESVTFDDTRIIKERSP